MVSAYVSKEEEGQVQQQELELVDQADHNMKCTYWV
jgi:hypothetical protein